MYLGHSLKMSLVHKKIDEIDKAIQILIRGIIMNRNFFQLDSLWASLGIHGHHTILKVVSSLRRHSK